MNQPLTAGAVDARGKTSSSLETPTLLAAAEVAAVVRPVQNLSFVEEVRTHMTTILGFAEMLDDPALELSSATRAEYGLIVAASGALLASRLQRRSDELRLAS